MRESTTLGTLLLSAAIFLPGALAAVDNDFSLYPSAAQSCLYSAADGSGCDGDTVPEMNDCLCGNKQGGWVTLTADCLGSTGVDSSVIANTYSQMESNCGDSGNALGVTREEFFNHVDAASTSSSSTTTTTSSKQQPETTTVTTNNNNIEPTTMVVTVSGSATTLTTSVAVTSATSATSDPTDTATTTSDAAESTATNDESNSDQSDKDGAFSTAKIGIIAGCASAAVVVLIIVVYLFMRKRMNAKKNGQVESHPMLGQQPMVAAGVGPSTFPPTEPSASPNPTSMYGNSPAGGAPATAYKDDDKWRQSQWSSTAASPQPGTGYSAPQQQWMHPGQQGQYPGSTSPQPGMQGPYAIPANQPQQFAAELPDNHGVQLYELGDATAGQQRPQGGRR